MSVTSTNTDNAWSKIFGETQSSQVEKKEDPLGRDAFMKMLIAQMQNQDPLNPMESADFSAQLAQFSSLEQMINMNTSLSQIQQTITNSTDNSTQNILDYIGKNVIIDGSTLTVTDGSYSGGWYTLSEPAEVYATIYDENGSEVRSLYLGAKSSGSNKLSWDVADSLGDMVEDGKYYLDVKAIDADGNEISVDMNKEGEVSRVLYKNGEPYLVLTDGRQVKADTVIEVYNGDQEESSNETSDDSEQESDSVTGNSDDESGA